MKRRIVTLVVIIGLMIPIFLGHVAADVTVKAGSHLTSEIDLWDDGSLEFVAYVVEGIPIDVAVFEKTEYEKYLNDELAIFEKDCTVMNSVNINIKCNLKKGDYKLVIDNTDWGMALPNGQNITYHTTKFQYKASLNTDAPKFWYITGRLIAIIVAVVIIVVIVVVRILSNRRK
jgi:hypothetical protein